MCGRYSLEANYEVFASRYGLEIESIEYQSSPEIFPTQKQVILVNEEELAYGKWGFTNPYSSKPLINARLETITEKPTFKESFEETRCLIPATSFFEWEKTENEKIKRKVFVENQLLFSMAGIMRQEGDELVFSILTTESNDDFKKIHHRMPVILEAKDELKYLNKNTSIQQVVSMCQNVNPSFLVI